VQTVRLVLLSPAHFFIRLLSSNDLQRPLQFGYFCMLVGAVVASLWAFILPVEDEKLTALVTEQGMTVETFKVLQLVMAPFSALLQLCLGTLILHAAAMLVGGKARLIKTFQICAYGAAAHLLLLIPWPIGVVATLGFQIFIQFNGLKILHGLSNDRATLACMVPLGLMLLFL